MHLGLFTVLFPELNLEELLEVTVRLGFESIELSGKSGRGLRHFNPEEIVGSEAALTRFTDALKRSHITVSQLNCATNPVSPIPGAAEKSRADFELTFRLAEKLKVDTVCSFSGCPGGGPRDQTPNWVTCPWPPEFLDILNWQWEERLIPFWTWASSRAAEYGVTKLAIEMHPGFCVYNPETLLKLRRAVGNSIGANLDPSHLIWQGIDIPAAIRALKGIIWHFHAKDTFVNQENIKINGVLDTKHYSDLENRSWLFRTVGYGMTFDAWKAILSELRIAGYDGVVCIEHEDALMSKMEGLTRAAAFLKGIIYQDAPEKIWWA